MTEYEVDVGHWPRVRIAAGSQEEAEAIARKDGHLVKTKAECDREQTEFGKKKQAGAVKRATLDVQVAQRQADRLREVLATLTLCERATQGAFDYQPSFLAVTLASKHTDCLRSAILSVTESIGVLLVALPAVEQHLMRLGSMSPDAYLDEFGSD